MDSVLFPAVASSLSLLQLLQLADSALPIGSLAHSFGLEALVFDEDLETCVQTCPASLGEYLHDCLSESLLIDAVFCRQAHTRAVDAKAPARTSLVDLNQKLSAFKLARESREASMTLGRRFAALAASLHPCSAFTDLAREEELHHSVAFGYTFGTLGLDPALTVSAFLHQSVLNVVSAAQRLLPLGQIQANRIAWNLKPAMLEAANRAGDLSTDFVGGLTHLPETASMRHSCLPTRLFIS